MCWPCVYKITVFPSLWNISHMVEQIWSSLTSYRLTGSLKSIYFSHFTYLPSYLYTHWFLYNMILPLCTIGIEGKKTKPPPSPPAASVSDCQFNSQNCSEPLAVFCCVGFTPLSSLFQLILGQKSTRRTIGEGCGCLEEKGESGPWVAAC